MTAGSSACSSVHRACRMKAGPDESRGAVGAEANKLQPAAEQGHQIKVCSLCSWR